MPFSFFPLSVFFPHQKHAQGRKEDAAEHLDDQVGVDVDHGCAREGEGGKKGERERGLEGDGEFEVSGPEKGRLGKKKKKKTRSRSLFLALANLPRLGGETGSSREPLSLAFSFFSLRYCALEVVQSSSLLRVGQAGTAFSPTRWVENQRERNCSPRRRRSFVCKSKKKTNNFKNKNEGHRRAQRGRDPLHDDQADADSEGKRSFSRESR